MKGEIEMAKVYITFNEIFSNFYKEYKEVMETIIIRPQNKDFNEINDKATDLNLQFNKELKEFHRLIQGVGKDPTLIIGINRKISDLHSTLSKLYGVANMSAILENEFNEEIHSRLSKDVHCQEYDKKIGICGVCRRRYQDGDPSTFDQCKVNNLISINQVRKLLTEDEYQCTFNCGNTHLMATWGSQEIIEALSKSQEAFWTGDNARSMGYEIAILEPDTKDFLFIRTGKIDREMN